MKYKQKIRVFFVAIIITLLCCGMTIIHISMVHAEEKNVSLTSYTDSDNFNFGGVNYELKEYIGNLYAPYNITDSEVDGLYASTMKNSLSGIICSSDDPIVGIIPKELFTKPNSELVHIGNEYGFFIKTDEVVDGVYVSTISVFNIVNRVDDKDVKDSAIFSLKHLFQREFVYVAKSVDAIPIRSVRLQRTYSQANDKMELVISITDSVVGKVCLIC